MSDQVRIESLIKEDLGLYIDFSRQRMTQETLKVSEGTHTTGGWGGRCCCGRQEGQVLAGRGGVQGQVLLHGEGAGGRGAPGGGWFCFGLYMYAGEDRVLPLRHSARAVGVARVDAAAARVLGCCGPSSCHAAWGHQHQQQGSLWNQQGCRCCWRQGRSTLGGGGCSRAVSISVTDMGHQARVCLQHMHKYACSTCTAADSSLKGFTW